MNYGLLLYLKLARVDVGNVSKKGEIWKVLLPKLFLLVGFILNSVYISWFFSGNFYPIVGKN